MTVSASSRSLSPLAGVLAELRVQALPVEVLIRRVDRVAVL
jgi:hypothetical protein